MLAWLFLGQLLPSRGTFFINLPNFPLSFLCHGVAEQPFLPRLWPKWCFLSGPLGRSKPLFGNHCWGVSRSGAPAGPGEKDQLNWSGLHAPHTSGLFYQPFHTPLLYHPAQSSNPEKRQHPSGKAKWMAVMSPPPFLWGISGSH